jgi:hypothetical protein
MKLRQALGVGMSCWVLGCGVDASQEGGSRELCPSCTPLSGGETSDFGGGQENCEEDVLPLTEDVRDELGVDEIMVALSEPFSAALRFAREDEERPDTTFTATATFGTPEYRQVGVDATDACRDSVLIPVELSVAASDGAFTADAAGALRVRRGDLAWQLLAAADLAGTAGNLELDVDDSRPHLGQLLLNIKGFPAGPRGDVRMKLYYPGDGAPSDRIPQEDAAPGSDIFYADVARFPADHCGSDSFPIDSDESHGWLGGQAARELYVAAGSSIPTLSAARWRDGDTTEISVTLGELPAASEACLGESFGDARLRFDSSARVRTEDDRVDAEIVGSELALSGTSGAVRTLYLSQTSSSMTPSEAESEAGIGGLDTAGIDLLSIAFELEYGFEDDVASGGGIIDVIDNRSQARVDCVAWPEGSSYQEQRCVPLP